VIYQLPNGKIIHLTVDQYLDLTDEDIEYMMSINYGEYARSPFQGSSISRPIKKKKKTEEEDIDTSLDYVQDSEEIVSVTKIILSEDAPIDDSLSLENFSPEED
jgi:hypothetical protein